MGHCHRDSHDSKNTLEPFGTCPHEQSTLSSDRTSPITEPDLLLELTSKCPCGEKQHLLHPCLSCPGATSIACQAGCWVSALPTRKPFLEIQTSGGLWVPLLQGLVQKRVRGGGEGTGRAEGSNQLSFVNVFYLLGGFPFGKIQPHFSKGIQ